MQSWKTNIWKIHKQFDSDTIHEKIKNEGIITSVNNIIPRTNENILIGERMSYFFKIPTKNIYANQAGRGMHIKESIVIVSALKNFENAFDKIKKAILKILKLVRIKIAQKKYAINQQYLDLIFIMCLLF